jgi:hypothetical protein
MNYKQQKRIKDAALMVRNAFDMSSNMQSININYACDLEGFLKKIKDLQVAEAKASAAADAGSEIMLTDPNENNESSQGDGNSDNGKQEESCKDAKSVPAPPWAKDLYRKIMKKCHPDKIVSSVLTPEERLYRAESLQAAMDAYAKEEYNELIYAGAIVDEYTQKITAAKQITILNRFYNTNSLKITKIQDSVSWSWGISWDTIETRVLLVIRLCLINKIKPVSKEELIVLLTEHEMK